MPDGAAAKPLDGAAPEPALRYELVDHVAWITLNRPERLNALSKALLQDIVEAAAEATEDPDVWVVVFRGAGGRAFSVGADLKELRGHDETGRKPSTPMVGARRNAFEAVLEIPKPVIASIEGYCLAGGFELSLACDLRLAADDATFGMPEAKIGMGANFASVLLPRLLPRAVALEMLYLGERITAETALGWGLLNAVVPKAELADHTADFVGRVVRNAPLTLRRYKEMTSKGWEMPVSSALRLNVGPNPYTSADRVEGVAAFLEKRAPRWEAR